MRNKIVAGNWKMNGRSDQIKALLLQIIELMDTKKQTQCVVFPPAVYLPLVKKYLSESAIRWCAQNVYPQ